MSIIYVNNVGFLVLLIAMPSFSNNLPLNFPKCYVNDPELNECMLRAFNSMRDRARTGIKEIGLSALNKIVTPLTIKQESPYANYTLSCTDYTVEGLDNYDFTEFRYDPKTMTVRGGIQWDSLLITGHVNVTGQVLFTDFFGYGFARAGVDQINATFEIKGQNKRSKGLDFYDTRDVKVDLTIDDSSYYINGFFDHDEQLNNMGNQMLNSNSKMITEIVLTPVLENMGKHAITRFMKSFTKRIPYNKILLSSE